MRSLSTKTDTATTDVITNPTYLIELQFTVTLRLSTGAAITWNSLSWVVSGASVKTLRRTPGGDVSGVLSFANHNDEWTSVVLNETVRDVPVKIWMIQGASPYALGDAELLVDGALDEVTNLAETVDITFLSEGSRTRNSPRIPLSAFVGADMTAPGTIIYWGGESYVLEARQ